MSDNKSNDNESQIDNFLLSCEEVDPNDAESVSYWLDQPDDNNRPKQSNDCITPDVCGDLLSGFWTKKNVKIANLSGTYCGIDEGDYEKLCPYCRNSVYNWYKTEIGGMDVPIDIFKLILQEDNAANRYNSAYETLLKMVNNEEDYVQEEIDDYIQYYQSCKKGYEQAKKKLDEEVELLEMEHQEADKQK